MRIMNKTLIAATLTSLLTITYAQADTTLYGSIGFEYQSKKFASDAPTYDANGRGTFSRERLSNIGTADHEFGFRGTESLGGDTSVIYNLEWKFHADNDNYQDGLTTHIAYLGLTGNWGTFKAGRQDNPFKVMLVDSTVNDDFNGSDVISSAAESAMTTALGGVGITMSNGNNTYNGFDITHINFKDKNPTITADGEAENYFDGTTISYTDYSHFGHTLSYTTPDFAGFQANAAIMMNAALYPENNKKGIDLWTINAQYGIDAGEGQILAQAGYIQGHLVDRDKSKVWGAFLGYLSDEWNVTASYADGNYHKAPTAITTAQGTTASISNKAKSKGWDLGASFSFGANYDNTIRASYGQNQVKQFGAKDKVKSWAIGYQNNLSSRTTAWVEYGVAKTTFNQQFNNLEAQKNSVVSIGLSHDF